MCDNQITEISQICFWHIVEYHSATKPFFTLCSVDSCNNRAFTVYSTFRRHWYLCHHNRGRNPPVQNHGIFSLIHQLRSYIAWHLNTVIMWLLCIVWLEYFFLIELLDVDLSCETDSGKNDAVALQPANEDEEVSVTDATITQPAISKDIFTAGFLLALRHQHFLSFETLAFVQKYWRDFRDAVNRIWSNLYSLALALCHIYYWQRNCKLFLSTYST